jgi:hypothetical protein
VQKPTRESYRIGNGFLRVAWTACNVGWVRMSAWIWRVLPLFLCCVHFQKLEGRTLILAWLLWCILFLNNVIIISLLTLLFSYFGGGGGWYFNNAWKLHVMASTNSIPVLMIWIRDSVVQWPVASACAYYTVIASPIRLQAVVNSRHLERKRALTR